MVENDRSGVKPLSIDEYPEDQRGDAWESSETRAKRAANGQLVTTCMAQIEPRPVDWLVPGMVPLGKLVLLAGDGGHGKSTLSLDLAAALSRGRAAFSLDYPDPVKGDTLLIQCEDDAEDTIAPRLIAANANRGHVHLLEGVRHKGDAPGLFTLAHAKALDDHLEENPATRLVVIDPAGAYVGAAGVNDDKDSELRALLGPLAKLAARRRATVLLIKHFIKGATAKAVHKVGGSVAYVNAMRSAFVVTPSRDNADVKLFLPLKFNLGPKPMGLSYRLQSLPDKDRQQITEAFGGHLPAADQSRLADQLFRIEWLGPVSVTADEALAIAGRAPGDPTKVEQAMEWLKDFLGEFAYPSTEIASAGKSAGFNFDNLKSAKERLKAEGLRNQKIGFQGIWWSGFGDPGTWKHRPTTEQRGGQR